MLQLFSGGFVHVERSNGFTPLRWIKRPTDPHNNQGKPAEYLNCLSKTPKKKALKKDIHSSIHPPNLTSTSPAASKGYHNQTPQTDSPTAQKPAPHTDRAYPLPTYQHNHTPKTRKKAPLTITMSPKAQEPNKADIHRE